LTQLSDPRLRAEMGARGRAFAESSWNAHGFADVVRTAIGMVQR
jgi:hypothetical protein